MEVGSSDAREPAEPEYPIASAGSVVTRRMRSEAQVELPGGGPVGPLKVRKRHADQPDTFAGGNTVRTRSRLTSRKVS